MVCLTCNYPSCHQSCQGSRPRHWLRCGCYIPCYHCCYSTQRLTAASSLQPDLMFLGDADDLWFWIAVISFQLNIWETMWARGLAASLPSLATPVTYSFKKAAAEKDRRNKQSQSCPTAGTRRWSAAVGHIGNSWVREENLLEFGLRT